MGYGLKTGIWNGKKTLTWRMGQGTVPDNLERAFDIWQKKIDGLTFTKSEGTAANVDFVVKSAGSQSAWSGAQKSLNLKGNETLGAMLHEIGHLLGLSHEHDRPDNREKYYSASDRSDFDKQYGLQGAITRSENLQAYGSYDNDSIMQYPASSYNAKSEPSAGDVTAVKAINGWS